MGWIPGGDCGRGSWCVLVVYGEDANTHASDTNLNVIAYTRSEQERDGQSSNATNDWGQD
jgi:hypothetical protein